MLTACVGDKYEIFVTEVLDFFFEKVINIMILPATSSNFHRHKVTNITVT